MRILQVVTLATPTGAYGGPVRVAVNQCRALNAAGHRATIAAGSSGFEVVPHELEGVPAQLFPAKQVLPKLGFAGLAAPKLSRWFSRTKSEFDVVHVHLARDLVTLPIARAALRADVPLVVQTHGMIDPSDRPLAGPLDAAMTRPILRRAKAVLHLTSAERQNLLSVAGSGLALHQLDNGVPEATERRGPAGNPEVLFLARLQERKRPLDFLVAAEILVSRYPDWRFTIVGPDEGLGKAVAERVSRLGNPRVAFEGPVAPESVLSRMSRAAIYVLPSVSEPYPMSVLEAMSVGLPVVVTDTCGLATAVHESNCGLVTDGSAEGLTVALDRLIGCDAQRELMGSNSLKAVRERFRMESIESRLSNIYRSVSGGHIGEEGAA